MLKNHLLSESHHLMDCPARRGSLPILDPLSTAEPLAFVGSITVNWEQLFYPGNDGKRCLYQRALPDDLTFGELEAISIAAQEHLPIRYR